jgi:hypothetical protein
MRVRPFVRPFVTAALVLAGPLIGYQVAVHDARSAPKSHHVYRLDYVVSVTEPGKPAVTSAYALNLEEGSGGDVHAGTNIPLQTASSSSPSMSAPRQDVGIRIRSRITRAGSDLLLHGDTELSGLDEARADQGPRAIRKINASGDAVVTPGKPALVASVEEPVSHARYEVTVTATKLR